MIQYTRNIRFSNADINFRLKNSTRIKAVILEIFKREKFLLHNLRYIFCSDEFLLNINRKFLQHDYYTDIITFDLSEGEGTIGEIYISIDRVKENALEFHSDFYTELLRVIFHGALHLCGYKDKTPAQEKTMRKKEEEYLQLFEELPK